MAGCLAAPRIDWVRVKPRVIAGTALEPCLHSEAGNGKRDGLKTARIGQSAAERQELPQVQRLYPGPLSRADEIVRSAVKAVEPGRNDQAP